MEQAKDTAVESLQEPGPSAPARRVPDDPSGRLGKRPRLSYSAPGGYRRSLEQTGAEHSLLKLYVTEGLGSEVRGHEEALLETRRLDLDAAISCTDVLKPLAEQQGAPLRAVLTVGVAGAGKTASVLRFCLDWAQGSQNQELQLVVPMFLRELHLVRGRCSLMELIQTLHPSLQPLAPEALTHDRVLFICDGLDESRRPLDFSCEVVSEVTQRSEVSVLLVNLIRGDLLPEAQVWITSRPAAARQVPARCLQRVTELRGFSSEQQEVFFRTRFSDQQQLHTVLSHLRTSPRLRTMSLLPAVCSITATVLGNLLSTESSPLPQTLSDLYAHLLSMYMQEKKRGGGASEMTSELTSELTSDDHELLLKLGRLAFEQLQKGNVMFYPEDLQRAGLDRAGLDQAGLDQAGNQAGLDRAGLDLGILRWETVLPDKRVLSFVHLSVQEFLAAVHLLHCFNTKKNKELRFVKGLSPSSTVDVFLRKALHTALNSPSGHLDLVVRFLHGLLLESNQRILGDLLGPPQCDPQSPHRVIISLKEMKTKASPDRSLSIVQCLAELHDGSLQQEVQDFLSLERDKRSRRGLSAAQCSALALTLLTSDQVLDKLDLRSYNSSSEARLRLVPAVRNCTQALFQDCHLSKVHLEIVASALSSRPSHLRVLDLSENPEVNSEMQALCEGLQSHNCQLESLKLNTCTLSEVGCSALASALRSNPSHLRVLDLRDNSELRDPGVEQLCSFLQSPQCRLETLNLRYCSVTELGCSALASALTSLTSLRVLDLQGNKGLRDSGVEHLCGFLRSPDCRLEVLSLYACDLTEVACSALASALTFNPSHLRDLDLGVNRNITDRGLEHLSGFLRSPHCRLEVLRLKLCGFSRRGCVALAEALSSCSTHLRQLNMWANSLSSTDVQELQELQQSSTCPLQELFYC